MIKRIIFSLTILTLGLGGIMLPKSLSASNYVQVQGNEITSAELILVCCELADRRILNLGDAGAMLRDGRLTITKIDSGVYRVVYPGGVSVITLEIDNI